MQNDKKKPLGDQILGFISGFRPRLPSLPGLAWLKSMAPLALGFTQPWQIIAGALVVGIAGTSVVALLNTPADQLREPDGLLSAALLFVLSLLTYRWVQRQLLQSVSTSVEQSLDRLRARLAGKVARLDLRGFESLPRVQLQGGLSNHYVTISDAALGVLTGVQSLTLLVLTLAYLCTISLVAVLLSLAVFVVAIQAYQARHGELQARMHQATEAEAGLAGSLVEILDGFTVLRLNLLKRTAVLDEICRQSTHSAQQRASTAGTFSELLVFGNSMAFLMGGAVVFLLPILAPADTKDLPRLVAATLFMIGPLGSAVGAANQFVTARFAINSLSNFESELDLLLHGVPVPADVNAPPFQTLEAQALTYVHRPRESDEPPYTIGPINLKITAGEVIFITGGNGSGKTTMLRALSGLYPLGSGSLILNGRPLPSDGSEHEAYQQLFGAVFAEAHVFRHLYALPPHRMPAFHQALLDLEIAHKLPADLTMPFNPDMLSTGQRKRLALAVALAEDRPVIILDEWAADQDPRSRERFYRELLPRLRAEGKAVIAITHDDRYFDAADRRYHMEEGHMTLVHER